MKAFLRKIILAILASGQSQPIPQPAAELDQILRAQ
jgi:hypothetical protein